MTVGKSKIIATVVPIGIVGPFKDFYKNGFLERKRANGAKRHRCDNNKARRWAPVT